MGNDNKTKRVILWYTAVVCLAISTYAPIFLIPLNIGHYGSSLLRTCYDVPIYIFCMVLIPSLLKGTRQSKDICRFALFSVVCLALACFFLRFAMFVENHLRQHVFSGILFGITVAFACFSPLLALVSIFRILFIKARLAGLWFSVAIISFVAFETAVPEMIKFYIRTHPHSGRVCSNNLRGFAIAIEIYSFDFDKKLPTVSKWCDLLKVYADLEEKRFLCPADKPGPCSYAMNKFASSDDVRPDDMVLLFESKPGWN